jgi:hypothetical protein
MDTNGVVTTLDNATGTGNFTVSKTTTVSEGTLTIYNRENTMGSLSLKNICVTNPELEVITLVVGDDLDVGKSMTNKYEWTNSTTSTNGSSSLLDIFTSGSVTRFNSDTGNEGENEIPYNNSTIKVTSTKATGEFTSCNRIGYVITASDLTPQQILDSATYPAITNSGDNNYIQFTFTRTAGQKLYIVWDYIDVENCDIDPTPISLCYSATDYALACECDIVPVNCVVSDWSPWSACVNGSQTRTRTIVTPASGGGTPCPVLTETENCTVPVDCVVSAWSDWSSCTNGSQTRTRTVVTPASGGGVACPVLTETQDCSSGCVNYTISTSASYGTTTTYTDCYGNQQQETIGGVNGAESTSFCATEGTVSTGPETSLSSSGNCGESIAVNCVVSEWSAWSECANGNQTRTRTIITPASNGGVACPVLSETQPCSGYVTLNYNVSFFGGIYPGSFEINSNGINVFSTTNDATGSVSVLSGSLISSTIYAPVGDTSSGQLVTHYTRVIAQDGGGVIADSGLPTSNASSTIDFYANSTISIQADASTDNGSGGEVIQ